MKLKLFLKSKKFWVHLFLIVIAFAIIIYMVLLLLKGYTHHGKTISVPDFTGLTEDHSQMITDDMELRYQIIDSVYMPDIQPGTIISQHPSPDSKVKKSRTIYFTMSAISPEKVKLPVIVDVSLREAQSRLENAGLRLGKIEYRPSEFLNLVLDCRLHGESLPADTFMVKGTHIDLIVGKGLSNEKTLIPNLYGNFLPEAREMLYNLSLNSGALVYDHSVKNAQDSTEARVWRQNPRYAPSEYVELGISVDLWLTVDIEKLGDMEMQPDENIDNNETEAESDISDF